MRTVPARLRPALAATMVTVAIVAAAGAAVAVTRAPAAAAHSAAPDAPGAMGAPVDLDAAEEVLIQRCMRRAGYEYWVADPRPVTGDRDFPYVVDDTSWAAAHGYGSDVQERIDEARRTDPNAVYFSQLSPQQQVAATTALVGAGPGRVEAVLPAGGTVSHNRDGCMATAESQLYGDLDAWYRVKKIAENLSAVRRAQVVTAPAFQSALHAWSACMHRHGQPFATPDDARAALSAPEVTGGRAIEVSRAVVEAECAGSSGLAATARRLDAAAGRDVAQRYRAVLRVKAALERAAGPRATAILAEP